MELSEFVGRPCKSHLAFEFLPKHEANIDLEKTSSKLKKMGIEIEFETPVFVSLKVGGKSVSVFKSGKIMVKETREEAPARKIAEKLVKEIY